MKHYYIALLLTVPAFSLASEWFEGENLLVEPPDTEIYDTYTKKESGWQSTLWHSKAVKGDDTYVVNVVSGKPGRLGRFRKIQDKPGQDACSEFGSKVIDDTKRNGYKSMFWHTTCRVQGVTIRTVQLAIGGRDSLYHVRKSWKVPVSEADFELWKATMSEISVCDTRDKKHPCPEGYKKVSES